MTRTKRKVLIAHASDEQDRAKLLATPLENEGYEVIYYGNMMVGESVVNETSKHLKLGVPVLICATYKAVATSWVSTVENAARSSSNPKKIIIAQMDEGIPFEGIRSGEKIATYYLNPEEAIKDIICALEKCYSPGRKGKKSLPLDTKETVLISNSREGEVFLYLDLINKIICFNQ
jgi:methylmalonyl-CoA mutase cobalamin-binding subunit